MSKIREKLIEATFEEVYISGYDSASLSSILKRANVKKGSMYHYFSSKEELILTMVKEVFENRILSKWNILENTDKSSIDIISNILLDPNQWDLKYGCPLGNLLQETLPSKDLNILLNQNLQTWKNIFIEALERDKHLFKNSFNSNHCATFLIATIEGALLMVKKSNNPSDFKICMEQLILYLSSHLKEEI